MRNSEKMAISVQVLTEAMKRKNGNKSKLARDTGYTLQTIRRIFREKKASMKTILAIGEVLDVSPSLLLNTAYDYNGSYNFSDPSDWETFKQWKKSTKAKISPEAKRMVNATAALTEYLDNVIIINPKTGKPYNINGTLLFTSDFKLEERIKQTIRDYIIETNYKG